MTQKQEKSGQINLEYVVRFDDGLKPRLLVYGVDSKSREIYGADVSMSVIIGTEGYLGLLSEDKFKAEDNGGVICIRSRRDIRGLTKDFRRKIPDSETWEQRMHEEHKEKGCNVIKIQSPEHVDVVIDMHSDLYLKQFDRLIEESEERFKKFMREHPGYR
jgi:hypothetical protein